jgi:hypothetical protein
MVNILLKPGIAHDAADAELQPLLERFAHDMPKHFPEHFQGAGGRIERLGC